MRNFELAAVYPLKTINQVNGSREGYTMTRDNHGMRRWMPFCSPRAGYVSCRPVATAETAGISRFRLATSRSVRSLGQTTSSAFVRALGERQIGRALGEPPHEVSIPLPCERT